MAWNSQVPPGKYPGPGCGLVPVSGSVHSDFNIHGDNSGSVADWDFPDSSSYVLNVLVVVAHFIAPSGMTRLSFPEM